MSKCVHPGGKGVMFTLKEEKISWERGLPMEARGVQDTLNIIIV